MKWCSAGMWHFPRFLDDHFVPPPTVQMVNGFCYSTRVFFFHVDSNFFCLDSNFKILNRVCNNDICLVFFRSWTYILQISTHVFYCIRCILQVSTYVLCFQHVFTIGIILSATERHTTVYSGHGRSSLLHENAKCDNILHLGENHNKKYIVSRNL